MTADLYPPPARPPEYTYDGTQMCIQPSSVVSEEVSEESSVTVTSAACGCHHQHGCAIGAIGGQMPAGENGFSVEVRDRLKELQGRTSTLEQEKAR